MSTPKIGIFGAAAISIFVAYQTGVFAYAANEVVSCVESTTEKVVSYFKPSLPPRNQSAPSTALKL
jgi:hypothetical protein